MWDAVPGGANPGAQDGSGTWSHNGPNWRNTDSGANDRPFRNGDAVTFGAGSGSAGTITLSGAVSTNSITFNAPGSGNYVISGGTGITMSAGTIMANANATISSVLLGTGTLTKSGTGTLTLTGVNTYSGTTTVNRGTLELSGTGALTQTAGITLERGGVLKLRNTSSANSGDRLRNAAPLSLVGGTLWLADDGSNAAYTETVSTTKVVAGSSTISTVSSSAGSTTLRLTQISRNKGATLNFTGTNLGVTAQNRILVTGSGLASHGPIGGWATVNNEFARYDSANGVTTLTAADYVTTGEADWTFEGNAKITGNTTLTADRKVNSLNIAAAAATTVDLNGETLRVESGGILVSGSSAVTISNGTLTGGAGSGSAGEVILHQNSTAGLDVTATIADNGTRPTALVKSGEGTASLSGANSFTGGVFVNAGTLKVNHAAAINAANTLAVEGGTLDLDGNDVTVASLSSQTTYTDDDITYANKAGVITNTNAAGGARTLTAGGDNSSTTFSGQLGANLNFTKTGAGTFTLNQSNASYEGVVTVAQGTLVTGNSTALGATGAASKTVVQAGATLDITRGINRDEVLEVAGHGVNGRGAIVSNSHTTHNIGNMTLTGHTTVRADDDLDFDGTLSGGGFNLTKVGVQDLLLSGANVQNLGDVHVKLSTVTWSGSADLGISTNTLYVASGFTGLGATAQFTDKNSDAKRVTLAGGILRRNGTATGAAGQVLDVVDGLELAVGYSSIAHTNSQLVFQLNTIHRDVGATLNVDNNATLATTDTLNDAGGILGGFITVGGTDWAKNNMNAADGAIVAYTGYAANDFSSATNNVNVTGTQNATDATVHSLRFAQDGTTLNLTGTNTVVSGGILLTQGADVTISGGTLRGSAGGDLVFMHGTFAPSVTVSSTIADNTSATALTKAGGGVLELTGNNTYTGGTFLTEGVVEVNAIADSGVSNLGHSTGGTNNMITFNGAGTTLSLLDTGTDSATARNVMIMSDSWAFLKVGAGRQLELSGVISSESLPTGEGGSTTTIFTKSGDGTLIFSGTESNTFTGQVEVTEWGTLRLNKSGGATAIAGDVSVGVNGRLLLDQSNQIADTSVISVGGSFHLNGQSETVGGLRNSGSVRNFAATNGSLETKVVEGESYSFGGQIQDGSGGGTLSYAKSGAGTQTFTGSNTYTGATTLKQGTLQLGDGGTTGTLAAASNVIFEGGRLAINHSDDRTFSNAMSGSGTFAITGTGNITIDSANTHAGATEVQSGALYVKNTTGSATGSTAVVVSGTGVLGGTGRISGHTTIRDGGQLIAGNTPPLGSLGTLTLGDLTVNRQALSSRPSIILELGSNGSFIFNDAAGISANMGNLSAYFATMLNVYENESGVHDRLNVEGTMNLDAGAMIELRTLSYALKAGDVVDLLDFFEMNRLNAPGDRPWSAFQDLDMPTLDAGLSYDLSLFESNGIVVVIGAAPEPGRAMLLMFGLAGLVMRRRRRRV